MMAALTMSYGSDERELGDWDFGSALLTLLSQSASTVVCNVAGADPAADPEIPHQGKVVFRLYPVGTTVFDGSGTIVFRGRRTDYTVHGDGRSRGAQYVFSDPWWDMTQVVFQHYWSYRASGADANATRYFSRLNLFQDITAGPDVPWSYLTTKQQIQQIITYAAAAGADVQVGTVDPAWNVPVYGVKAIMCSEALQICLRPVPDACTFFDYTTDPPTLHVRQRQTLGAITLPFAGDDVQGRRHATSHLRPRPDLQADSVVIQYQKTNTADGVSYTNFLDDIYPPGSGAPQLGQEVAPIDLRGAVTTSVQGQVKSQAVDPTSVDFWKEKHPDLAGALVTGLALVSTEVNGSNDYGVKVKDRSGTNVSLAAYPNEVVGQGDVATWMRNGSGDPVLAQEVTITAWLTYTHKNPLATSQSLLKVERHQVTANVTLTNSVAGVKNYSALDHSDPGEPAVLGLAQNIYEALQDLQWEGEHTVVESAISSVIGIGNNLNLSGGHADWSAMAALVTSVKVDFFSGETTVAFGAHQHLTPAQLFEYLMMWRVRLVIDNPSVRSSGQASSASEVQLPEQQTLRDTTEGKHVDIAIGATASQDDAPTTPTYIKLDAEQLRTGALGTGLAAADRNVELKKLQCCVQGVKQFVIVPSSKTFDV